MTMTSAPVTTRAQNGNVPEDNPAARPKRRQFSADYKLAILEEYERITEDGGKGALLRREGLYSSHIVEWQRAREVGALAGLTPKHRKKRSPAERELERLRKKTERLEDQLARHRQALEIQGKASELLAQLLAESDPETYSSPPTSGDRRLLLRSRAPPRHEDRLCGGGTVPGHPLPQGPSAPGDAEKAPSRPGQQTERHRGRRRARRAALAPLRRLLARPGVLHPPRRGDLSGQRVELLPDPAGPRRGP